VPKKDKLRNKNSSESSGDVKYTIGLCGLNNLGNTCYMNSALQCLSNVSAFKEYFLSKLYKKEINTKNPIGTGGQLAKSYATLIKNMWSGNNPRYSPKQFKMIISKHATQFAGMNQHDAQELLAYLLDALHEDLNRVYNKPYIEKKYSDGNEDDETIANQAWEDHLSRNKSIIVDLFQGQFKSTVECPSCNKVSVTFDPFMYLQLPILHDKTRIIKVIFFKNNDPLFPKLFAITVNKEAKIKSLLTKLIYSAYENCTEEEIESKLKNIILTDVIRCRIDRIYKTHISVGNIADDDTTIAYEMAKKRKKNIPIKIVNRRDINVRFTLSPFKLFGLPTLLFIDPSKMTGKKLYLKIFNLYKKFMQKQLDDENQKEKSEEKDNDGENQKEKI